MCPKLRDGIRPGIEVCAEDPRELNADALLLPWRGDEEALRRLLGVGAAGVLAQLREYPPERDIRLTSPGLLPSRFLLHLALPHAGSVDPDLLRRRLGECFRHARVLALRDLALPVSAFAALGDEFSVLAELIWSCWKEDGGADLRLRLLADEHDLRGEFLRRFLQRRRGAELARSLPHRDSRTARLEGALRPRIAAGLDLEQALERLLEDYRDGRPLDDAMGVLAGPMRRAFGRALDPGERIEDLPGVLRVLGPGSVQRLPWELLREGATFLGERFVLPRGTSFFVLGGRAAAAAAYSIEVRSEPGLRGAFTQELRNLLHRAGGRQARTEDTASLRILFASGPEAWEALLAEDEPAGGELLFLDQPEDWSEPVDAEELAGRFLARGYRRVLSPLAPFRDHREARIFRMAFFEQFFRGHGAGGALRYAQRSLLEAFGIHSGWFLYRIFGQAEDHMYAAGSGLRRGYEL